MRRTMRNVVCAALAAGLVSAHGALSADDSAQAESATPTRTAEHPAQYYGWLDKFENPSAVSSSRPRATQPRSDGEQAVATTVGGRDARVPGLRSGHEQAVTAADAPPPTRQNATVSSNDDVQSGAAPADIVFEENTAEPGEGLGCYYHRAYYSHLPMFKDDVYSLRGSFDVAETYRKPSDAVVSSPDEVTPRESGS